jgi:L-amino acid N-acyltransferase YncA
MVVRPATSDDAAAISAIYNEAVLNSTATYQEEPETVQDRLQWLGAHGHGHPVMVAEIDGFLAGWAALSRFHPRGAYRFTVENSVYIHVDYRRRGLGRALMLDLIERARQLGHRSIIAIISGDQEPSIELHRSLGFTEVGRLRAVGFKFGRWLDVVNMQLDLQ